MTKLATPTSWRELPLVFECEGDRLIGVAALPESPIDTGVIIVVGGPQYRAGSHRQFTLLARQLAEQGIASFRFDYRGMGDSEGDMRNFENIDADIKAAIDTFMTAAQSVRKVAIWGLCDAASAALYYGHTDSRVTSLILANPWVHSPAAAARARLKYYYLERVLSKSFWVKLLSGQVDLGKAAGSLATNVKAGVGTQADDTVAPPSDPRHGSSGYVDRMLGGMKQFSGAIQFILSGKDMTAQEFMSLIKADRRWRLLCTRPHVSQHMIPSANHTFSSVPQRTEVSNVTSKFLKP